VGHNFSLLEKTVENHCTRTSMWQFHEQKSVNCFMNTEERILLYVFAYLFSANV